MMNFASDYLFIFILFYFQSEESLMELLQNLVDIDITFQELKVIDYIFFFEMFIFNFVFIFMCF
jgi:hypothetical protein